MVPMIALAVLLAISLVNFVSHDLVWDIDDETDLMLVGDYVCPDVKTFCL